MSIIRRVAEVVQRGVQIFFRTEDVFLEKRILRTFFLEKEIFFRTEDFFFFFLVLLQRGVCYLVIYGGGEGGGGSFTTIEFQRGFD